MQTNIQTGRITLIRSLLGHFTAVKTSYRLSACLILLSFIALIPTSFANSEYQRLLDDIDITQQGNCTYIKVIFSTRIQYLRHSPTTPSRQVAIQVKPLFSNNRDDMQFYRNETLGYPKLENLPLDTVRLEQAPNEIPLLTLSFTRDISSEVRQGHDFRSIDIAISETGSDQQFTCFK